MVATPANNRTRDNSLREERSLGIQQPPVHHSAIFMLMTAKAPATACFFISDFSSSDQREIRRIPHYLLHIGLD
jgi:hypothetical protein